MIGTRSKEEISPTAQPPRALFTEIVLEAFHGAVLRCFIMPRASLYARVANRISTGPGI